MKPVVLKGKRIVLRPLRVSDVPFLLKHINDPRINRLLGGDMTYPVSLENEKRFVRSMIRSWRKGVKVSWCVEHKLAKRTIGVCDLHDISKMHLHASLGIWIAPEFWKQGFGKEAASMVFDFGFGELGLNKISYIAIEQNNPSCALAKSLGGKLDGKLRQHVKRGYKYYDENVYSILRREWKKRS